MKLTPLPEQEEDAYKIVKEQDLPNFSLPGTGKTITALRATQLVGAQRGLILCPRIALSMWKENVEDFLGAKCTIVRSGSNEVPTDGDFVVTTYDMAWRLPSLRSCFAGQTGTQVLICDESQYIKNIEAERTKAVLGPHCDFRNSLAELFDQVWNMSGAPSTAFSDDLWTQVGVYHPEIFEPIGVTDYETFKHMFTWSTQKKYGSKRIWKIVGNTNELLLNKLIYKQLGAIRRTKISGMPEVIINELKFDISMSSAIKTITTGITMADLAAKLSDRDETDPLSKSWKTLGLVKVPVIGEYVNDLVATGPVLLGVWHRDVGNEYEAVFKKAKRTVVQVNGSTPSRQLEKIRDDFNTGKVDVLVGQMAAMGVSWNLQELCHRVVVAENHPSPSVLEQFYKRVARKGQKKNVIVDVAVANNDLDVALAKLSIRKEASNERIHGV